MIFGCFGITYPGMQENDDDDLMAALQQQADEWEASKPWNRWPRLWFLVTELIGAAIVIWAVIHYDLRSYADAFASWVVEGLF